MKILVTGGYGLLGRNLVKYLSSDNDVFFPKSAELDIRNIDDFEKFFSEINPDILIHCAAISKFADAEKRPIDTVDINVIGVANAVKCCMKYNTKIIFISSSHVFDGNKGNYSVKDNINPLTIYSKSKASGEYICQMHKNYLIIRTEFCDIDFPIEYGYVDKFSSKDYIDVLTPKIAEKCLSDLTGICHVGGERMSFYDFGRLRNPNLKKDTVQTIIKNSVVPILIDTSLISDCI